MIAIENVRLFDEVQAAHRELAESLEQQTATSRCAELISSSRGDWQPVFETVLESAAALCEANLRHLIFAEDCDDVEPAAHVRPRLTAERQAITLDPYPVPRAHSWTVAADACRPIHVTDVRAEPVSLKAIRLSDRDLEPCRRCTLLGVPMLKDDELVGAIMIYRQEVSPFTDKQIALVKLSPTRPPSPSRTCGCSTRRLRESLQQQTATADVLKVISRSTFDLPTVLRNA